MCAPSGRAMIVFFPALCALALLHVLLYTARFANDDTIVAILLYELPSAFAVALAAVRLRHAPAAERGGWLALFLALSGTAVVDSAWAVTTYVRDAEPGYPSWWDLPYLVSYALFCFAIALLTFPRWRRHDRRWMFDAGALMAVSAGIAWHFVVRHQGPIEDIVGTAYLVLDMCFFAVGFSVLYGSPVTTRNLVLAAAAFVAGVGDLLYYLDALAYDSAWLVTTWLFAIALAMPRDRVIQLPWLRFLRSAWLPYTLVAAMAAVTLEEMQRGRADDLLVAGVAALALVTARQFVSLRHALVVQRQETAFRQAVLETQSDLGLAMVILESGRIVFANGAAERISGLPAAELMALGAIEALAFERDRSGWRDWLDLPAQPDQTRIVRPDGTFAEVEAVARRFDPPDESRVLLVAQDVTERRQASEALAHAQKLEGLGALAGGVAHDFNNLLSAIIGHTALLRMGELDDEAGESVASIEAAALRGSELTRSLLDFARAQPAVFSVGDLRDCITETVTLARAGMPVNLNLEIDLGPGPAPVRMNRGQLVQALLNVILNARDAVGDYGRIAVCLSCSDGNALISVADTGAGMDEATRHRIFEPFFTTKRAGAGTGLGLAISQRTIRDHRGDLDVHSELGRGTTVSISLPLAAIPAPG